MLILNPHVRRAPYPADLAAVLNIARAHESRAWLSHWEQLHLAATPLYTLPGLAHLLGIARLGLKDESVRSPLGSFKALGAPIALVRLLLRSFPDADFTPFELITGRRRARLRDFTVISATDGNHGRALAAAAQSIGCRCVIVLHAHVDTERERAIAAFGAKIVRIAGNYDESVAEAARLAARNDWYVVSDTSYDGYEAVPRDVMQGYGAIAAELVEQTDARPAAPAYTHVILQGGVGGLAAGIASYLWEYHGAQRPRFVIVEPQQADCLLQSARARRAVHTEGSVDSVMAGLACGAASPLAWDFLEGSIDCFMTIDDNAATVAMRMLAAGNALDSPIVSGESGAAGLAGLVALCSDPAAAAAAGLDASSRVLLVNTEGATAPAVYHALVGETAESVLRRQRMWRPREAA
ncbi:diaminopropionate ammonia-lyase [Burkholderia alba]|uniref:diaminopropionate ammonia-lyase n=1 Tax=Burkholderia alba TaxID=2683677 RepID=UPI002B055916|nr:diaminopropionate ammonia-lyase [Burkholderia alba]